MIAQIENIKQQKSIQEESQVNQAPLKQFDKHLIFLKINIENFNKEIIMINANQEESEFGRVACVDCIQECPIQYISLEEANRRWSLQKGQSEDLINKYNSKRENKYNHTIQVIKRLRDNYNKTLNEIISSLDMQLNQNNDDIISTNKFNDKELFQLNEKQIEQITQLLCQEDQNKHIKESQQSMDSQDRLFYQNLKNQLENLMKYDIDCKYQIMKKNQQQNENNKGIDDNKNLFDSELHEFILKIEMQDQYLKIFNESVEFQQGLEKLMDQISKKGQIEQIININQEQTILKTLYEQFKFNSIRMKKLIQADENEQQINQLIEQKEQLLIQINAQNLQNHQQIQKISQLELEIKSITMELNNQIKEKQKELDKQILEKDRQIQELNKTINENQTKLNQKDEELKSIRQKNTSNEQKIQNQTSDIKDKNESIQKLQSDKGKLSNELIEKDRQIQELNQKYPFISIVYWFEIFFNYFTYYYNSNSNFYFYLYFIFQQLFKILFYNILLLIKKKSRLLA